MLANQASTLIMHADASRDCTSPCGHVFLQAAASRLDSIRSVYGPGVAKELLPLEMSRGADVGPQVGLDDGMAYRIQVRTCRHAILGFGC